MGNVPKNRVCLERDNMYNVTGHTLTQGINGNARPKSYVYKDGGDTLFEKGYLETMWEKPHTIRT